ncbi:MAG: fibrobacter succinogenes major paralogous domain-containing protein [Bacteroidales bacterium]
MTGNNFLFLICTGMIFLMLFQSCEKKQTDEPIVESGNVTDIEGNIYKTVKIGDQWWMAENLNVTKYLDGTSLVPSASLSDSVIWRSQGSYCRYDNNPNAPGLLYNWLAISNPAKLAPEGWHIPTDADWKILEMYLGMDYLTTDSMNWRGDEQGDKLKMHGTKYWVYYESVWGTNITGFSAMAGGCRTFNNNWSSPYGLNYMGFWWTSTSADENTAWYRHLDYKKTGIFRYYGPITNGFSVRCVKD